jgi:hypothetical protein
MTQTLKTQTKTSPDLSRLGFRKGLSTEWYKHLHKEGKRVYQAWAEILRIESLTGRTEGWTVVLGIQVDSEELLVKLAERVNQILEDLKKEGYKEGL